MRERSTVRAAAWINIQRAAAPHSRMVSKNLLTDCEPSVFWSPYRLSPIAWSIFTRFQSASKLVRNYERQGGADDRAHL